MNTQIKSLKSIRRKPPRNFKCCKMSTTLWEMKIVEPSIILEENLIRKTTLSSIFSPGNQMTARFVWHCGCDIHTCLDFWKIVELLEGNGDAIIHENPSTMSNKSCGHLISWAKYWWQDCFSCQIFLQNNRGQINL